MSLKAATASISKLLIEVTLLNIKMYQRRWTKAVGWLQEPHRSLAKPRDSSLLTTYDQIKYEDLCEKQLL